MKINFDWHNLYSIFPSFYILFLSVMNFFISTLSERDDLNPFLLTPVASKSTRLCLRNPA